MEYLIGAAVVFFVVGLLWIINKRGKTPKPRGGWAGGDQDEKPRNEAEE